jgi:hypothetical protein
VWDGGRARLLIFRAREKHLRANWHLRVNLYLLFRLFPALIFRSYLKLGPELITEKKAPGANLKQIPITEKIPRPRAN